MANKTFITVKPPLRAVDNGDGTFSVSVLDINSVAVLAAILALIDYLPLDAVTGARLAIDYAHHEIHSGSSFAVHQVEADFDKLTEIGVLFTTPDTAEWVHMVPLVTCGAAARFDILEAPTLDVGNYPTTFYEPRNRNRNSAHPSTVSSVQAVPVANEVSLKLKGDAAPVSADGTVLHCEIIGAGKKGGGVGNRDADEYVLKQNTTYYFRLLGLNVSDDVVASIELTWYEHTNRA
ncbi:MAG: hypothetical protein KAR06_04965 [Deltaproteobacteria bacterium]|nr:hypothetical protein [Deltaproteobacteria bacterium]